MTWTLSNGSFTSLLNAMHSTMLQQQMSMVRLATGLRINSGADDPAGLVSMSTLAGELASIQAASANASKVNSMMNTADAGMEQISDLVSQIQSLALEVANDSGLSESEKQAKQLEIDAAIDAIDRIVATTSYNSRKLIDGTYAIATTGVDSSKLDDVNITSRPATDSDINLTVQISSAAQRGQVTFSGAGLSSGNDVQVQVTGNLGSVVLSFAGSASIAEMASTVNQNTASTGVSAVASNGVLYFRSEHYGADQFVSVETLSGDFDLTGQVTQDYGVDPVVKINGQNTAVDDMQVSFNVGGVAGSFTLEESFAISAGGSESFTVKGGGATFALTSNAADQITIGIGSLDSYHLGSSVYGYLNSLKSGAAHNVLDDAATAVKIAEAASRDVALARANVGAFQSHTVSSISNMLADTQEQLTSAYTQIASVDYASEMANLTRLNVLMNTQASMMALMSQQTSKVMSLLGIG